MCGIIGYVGEDNATPILLHGLQKLEYRGYDSAGIAVREKNDIPTVVKAEGKLNNLISKVEGLNIIGTSGIGHSRWSTHGALSNICGEINWCICCGESNKYLLNIFYSIENKSNVILA